MKKLILILAIFVSFSSVPVVMAISDTAKTEVKSAIKEAVKDDKVTNLNSRATKEIDRRLSSLNNLKTKVQALKRLSVANQTSLLNQVQDEINNLTDLKTKIASDTDLATLKTDVQSIVQSYRIYALFIPKIHLLSANEVLTVSTEKVSVLIDKLVSQIDTAKANGQDVASLEKTLSNMKVKLADAKDKAASAQTALMTLTPDGYPGNKSVLKTSLDAIKAGRADLKEILTDAKTITSALKS